MVLLLRRHDYRTLFCNGEQWRRIWRQIVVASDRGILATGATMSTAYYDTVLMLSIAFVLHFSMNLRMKSKTKFMQQPQTSIKTKIKTWDQDQYKTFKFQSRDVLRPRLKSRELQSPCVLATLQLVRTATAHNPTSLYRIQLWCPAGSPLLAFPASTPNSHSSSSKIQHPRHVCRQSVFNINTTFQTTQFNRHFLPTCSSMRWPWNNLHLTLTVKNVSVCSSPSFLIHIHGHLTHW